MSALPPYVFSSLHPQSGPAVSATSPVEYRLYSRALCINPKPCVCFGDGTFASSFPPSLPPHLSSSWLTRTRRIFDYCNQNADQLGPGSRAGLHILTVYVGIVEYARPPLPVPPLVTVPYTYSSSTHRFPDERTPIKATPLPYRFRYIVLRDREHVL